ncbi:MAG TPA: hypothetical protein EYQ83_12650, partial [Acidobacteria bacterium]|nr:hypothetical protein [Acidobacteriota bacterium]
TFESPCLADPVIQALLPRITMRVDPALGVGQPALTEAVVTVRLRNGTSLERRVRGARGYPDRPPTAAELGEKFRACAERAVSPGVAADALDWLRDLERHPRVAAFSDVLTAVPA